MGDPGSSGRGTCRSSLSVCSWTCPRARAGSPRWRRPAGGWWTEHADGADAPTRAAARGWEAVLYSGEGPQAVPARKALELVRLADPHLPFLAVSPFVHAGDLAAMIRGLDCGRRRARSGAARRARSRGRSTSAARRRAAAPTASWPPSRNHRLRRGRPGAQRAGGARARHARRDARLDCGAVWRLARRQPLHCAATWHRAARRRTWSRSSTRRARQSSPPARACPGRGAFRRPHGHVQSGRPERAARRAGPSRRADDRGRVPGSRAATAARASWSCTRPACTSRIPRSRRCSPPLAARSPSALERRSPARWLDAAEAPLLALDSAAGSCSRTRTPARLSGAARTSSSAPSGPSSRSTAIAS